MRKDCNLKYLKCLKTFVTFVILKLKLNDLN